MDAKIVTNYSSFNIGFRVDVPVERLTMVTVGFMFWSVLIIFGGKFGGKDV